MPPKAPAAVAPIKVDAAAEEGAAGIVACIVVCIVTCVSFLLLHHLPPILLRALRSEARQQACFAPWLRASRPQRMQQTLPSPSPLAHTLRLYVTRAPLICGV